MLRTRKLPQLVLLMMLSVVRTGSAQTAAVGTAVLAHQCLRGDTLEWCRLALPGCKQYVESRAQSPTANPQEPEDDKIWNQMAGCELKLGQYADAAQHYEQTLKLRQKQYPGAHVLLASVHHDLGTAYSAQEKYADAEAQFRRALSMRQHLLGAEHADTQASLRAMGRALYLQQKYSVSPRGPGGWHICITSVCTASQQERGRRQDGAPVPRWKSRGYKSACKRFLQRDIITLERPFR